MRETYLMGVNVSKPLTALQGWPFFLTTSCMFRAVMSTARAAHEHERAATRRGVGVRTISRDMRDRVRLRDVPSRLAYDQAELH